MQKASISGMLWIDYIHIWLNNQFGTQKGPDEEAKINLKEVTYRDVRSSIRLNLHETR